MKIAIVVLALTALACGSEAFLLKKLIHKLDALKHGHGHTQIADIHQPEFYQDPLPQQDLPVYVEVVRPTIPSYTVVPQPPRASLPTYTTYVTPAPAPAQPGYVYVQPRPQPTSAPIVVVPQPQTRPTINYQVAPAQPRPTINYQVAPAQPKTQLVYVQQQQQLPQVPALPFRQESIYVAPQQPSALYGVSSQYATPYYQPSLNYPTQSIYNNVDAYSTYGSYGYGHHSKKDSILEKIAHFKSKFHL